MNKRPAEDQNVCSFFLERKKRHCRMKTNEGMTFCPHHSHLGVDEDPKKGLRVPCPYDSSHFCYEAKLQKHLKKCNAREKDKPKYHVESVNVEVNHSESLKLCLRDVPDDELIEFVNKIKSLYDKHGEEIVEIQAMHPVLRTEMEKSDDGFNAFKHMKQQASLLSVMEDNNFLKDGSCFIEFGAGKGQLMYWIISCIPKNEERNFILVDRSAQRHKIDNKFKDTDLQIERIRIDIQHLHLGHIESIQNKLDKVVGVSKHLCGAATDLAIKCLMDTLVTEEKVSHNALGLLMALCCHHRCSWNSYVGRNFLEECGITEREFQIMCCIASWATCGLRKTKTPAEKPEVPNPYFPENAQDENLLNRYKKLNLKHEEREIIGMQCKRLIDAGRVLYLRKKGYDTKLVTYIDKSVSLENVAMIAIYKGS
ncbi:hypothetical protein JTE90_020491 [Oedothorax gibbosus]|uniref:tRNA:m(4)X modification enzyme TRM13 n=1 Tax=Oedothorax gibbosus TaxID=931172 RepID=A0AAV6USL1_9ARAC|nr:hypothetical protein JTE90_020491 [Oedothorax gibbosus]